MKTNLRTLSLPVTGAILVLSIFTGCAEKEPEIQIVEVPKITTRIVPCKVPVVPKPKIITYSSAEAPTDKIIKVYHNYLNMRDYATKLEQASKVCQ